MEQKKKMAESEVQAKAQDAIRKLEEAKTILKNNAALTRILREEVRPSPEKMASVGAYGASNKEGSVNESINDDFHNEEDQQSYRDIENRVAWMDFENPYQDKKYHLKGLRCETDCGKETTTFFESPMQVEGKCDVKGFTGKTHSVTCEHAPSPIRKLGLLKSLAVAWPTGIAKMKAAQIRQEKEKWVARANEKQAFAHENNLELLVENFSESESVEALKEAVEAYEKRVEDAYEAQQAAFRTQISEWGKIQPTDPVSEKLQALAKTQFDLDFQWQWSTYKDEWASLRKVIQNNMSGDIIPKKQYTEALRTFKQIQKSALDKLNANIEDNRRQLLSSIEQQQTELRQQKYVIPKYTARLGTASDTLKTLHKYNNYLKNIRRLESSKKFDVFVEYKDLLETNREEYVKTFNVEIYNAWYTKLTEKTQSSSFFEWITGTQPTTIENLRQTNVDAAITLLEEVKANKQRLETEFVQRMHRDQEAEVERIEETARTLQTESGFDAVPAVDEHIQNLRQASAEVTQERRDSVTQYTPPLTPEARQFLSSLMALRPQEGFDERTLLGSWDTHRAMSCSDAPGAAECETGV